MERLDVIDIHQIIYTLVKNSDQWGQPWFCSTWVRIKRGGQDLMTAADTNTMTIFPSAEHFATVGTNKIPDPIMSLIAQQTVVVRKGPIRKGPNR